MKASFETAAAEPSTTANAPRRRVLSHPADLFIFWRGLISPFVLYAPFFSAYLREHIVIYAVALLFLIGNTNYVLHLHIHRPFCIARWMNIALDLIMGSASGMTASNWRIQHVEGHHGFDEALYRTAWGEALLKKFTLFNSIAYSVITVWPTFWPPIVVAFQRARAGVKTPIDYRWAFVEQILLIFLFAGLVYANAALAIFYVLPWWWLNFLMTRYVDFLNHFGCDEKSGNRLLCANNTLSPVYNYLTNNFGYHTAHHCKPSAHWTELPDIHAAIADRIPKERIKTYSWSCALMPMHMYLSARGKM
ncbi:MAG: fatty acid desaturase [Methylocystis sp.]|nr:fatty acid desaturase [Methylocystis sp.]